MLVLRQIRSGPVHLCNGRLCRIADCQTADLSRCRQVLLQQRRRQLQYVGDIVEAVAFVVGGQEVRDIDVQRQQIADRVSVFRAIQAMDGRPSGIRFVRSGAVERRFQV